MGVLILITFCIIIYLVVCFLFYKLIFKVYRHVIYHLKILINEHQINLKASLMMRNVLSFIVISIFIFDVGNVQGDVGFGFFLLPLILFLAPFFCIVLILLYNLIFHILLYCLIIKFSSIKFYKIYFLLSVISILFFQFIWWKWFYSEISLSRRVTVWNIVTIFFPLIPMLGLLLKHSGKLIK